MGGLKLLLHIMFEVGPPDVLTSADGVAGDVGIVRHHFRQCQDVLLGIRTYERSYRGLVHRHRCLGLAGRDLVTALIARVPTVKLLVTSRVRLGIDTERILELEGLAIPTNEAEVEQAAASQLFLHHAQHAILGRPLTQAERPHVVRICRLVEGLPLALVLAASWLRTLPCAAIADELEIGLSLLTTTAHNLPARQRDMRAVLAWSWQQLGFANQSVLGRLAGLRSGFNLEEARTLAGASRWQIQALRDASVLTERGSGYYSMHELMRRYAAEHRADYPDQVAQYQVSNVHVRRV